MSSRMTAAERRAFNDGLQAALLAICVTSGEDPFCRDGSDVCLSCPRLLTKQKQMCARIRALRDEV
jgi:hypothetical protein